MATVFGRNGRWFMQFKDATGAWKKRASDFEKKGDPLRMAIDLRWQAERIRLGLEPAPTTGPAMTYAQLYDWWWTEYGSKRRGIKERLPRRFQPEAAPPVARPARRSRSHGGEDRGDVAEPRRRTLAGVPQPPPQRGAR